MVSWSYNHCHVQHWVCYKGSAEMSQIHTKWSHFSRLVVILDFDDISIQKYGQFIIWSLSYSAMDMLWGGLQKCIKSISICPTFQSYCSFWWWFNTKVWTVDHTINVMFINGYAIRLHLQPQLTLRLRQDSQGFGVLEHPLTSTTTTTTTTTTTSGAWGSWLFDHNEDHLLDTFNSTSYS